MLQMIPNTLDPDVSPNLWGPVQNENKDFSIEKSKGKVSLSAKCAAVLVPTKFSILLSTGFSVSAQAAFPQNWLFLVSLHITDHFCICFAVFVLAFLISLFFPPLFLHM
jgi:hypothetical protein